MIDRIGSSFQTAIRENPSAKEFFEAEKTESFPQYLSRSMEEVNSLLNTADVKQSDLALGKSENIHEATISVEKAETALKFMTQVRNKAIEAYNDVLRMQF